MTKPATPLPWEVQKLHHVNDEPWYQIGSNGRGPIAELKYLVASDEHQRTDAAYIVEACNAYPKLIKALRQCEHVMSVLAGVGVPEALDNVRALLADLGEE